MNNFRINHLSKPALPGLRQQGLSLIELMVAVILGLFITLGLSQLFLSMYSTSASQNTLAQYQDNQRIAIVMLTNTTQIAGYYYNPTAQTANAALPSLVTANTDTSSFTAGTGITGVGDATGTTAATSDSINIYFLSSGSDNIYNCQGGIAAAGTPTAFVNSFSIDANNQLQCAVTTIVANVATGPNTPLVLATGVRSMNILYGVDVANTGTVSSYLSANAVQAAGLWANVRTVQITLNFLTPNVLNPGATMTTSIPWVQTINLMRQS